MTADPLVPTDALVVDEDRSWSTEQAWDLIDRLAHRAREAAFADPTAPRRVAVFAENAGPAVLAHVGGLRSGASVVAVSAHLNGTDAADLLERADVALVIAGPRTHEAARQAAALAAGQTGRPCHVRCWTDPDWEPWLAAAPAGPPANDRSIAPNLLFTSGTTGHPQTTELPTKVFPLQATSATPIPTLAILPRKGRELKDGRCSDTGVDSPRSVLRAGAAVKQRTPDAASGPGGRSVPDCEVLRSGARDAGFDAPALWRGEPCYATRNLKTRQSTALPASQVLSGAQHSRAEARHSSLNRSSLQKLANAASQVATCLGQRSFAFRRPFFPFASVATVPAAMAVTPMPRARNALRR